MALNAQTEATLLPFFEESDARVKLVIHQLRFLPCVAMAKRLFVVVTALPTLCCCRCAAATELPLHYCLFIDAIARLLPYCCLWITTAALLPAAIVLLPLCQETDRREVQLDQGVLDQIRNIHCTLSTFSLLSSSLLP